MKPMPNWPNGLVYQTEADIETREWIIKRISRSLRDKMRELNRAIDFMRVETPCLVPQHVVAGHIDPDGFTLWRTAPNRVVEGYEPETLYLRPESTKGTYEMFEVLLPQKANLKKSLPLCVWQAGLSFRVEQDKTFSHLRFKQFYQLEFQLAYSPDTKADYHNHAVEAMVEILNDLYPDLTISVAEQKNDEVPFYSERTTDIYVMPWECVAISTRKDFRFPILEVSCGLDRLVVAHQTRNV